MNEFIFIAIAFILIFIIVYRKNSGENVYKYISRNVGLIYENLLLILLNGKGKS